MLAGLRPTRSASSSAARSRRDRDDGVPARAAQTRRRPGLLPTTCPDRRWCGRAASRSAEAPVTRRQRMPGRPLVGLMAMAAAALPASCSANPTTSGPGDAPAGSAASGPHGGPTGPAVLTTIDGATVRVPSNKPSVLVFMSTNCADCADAARALVQVQAATKATARAAHLAAANARFLGVDMDVTAFAQTVRGFLHSVGAAGLPTVVDRKAVLAGRYQVTSLSTVL